MRAARLPQSGQISMNKVYPDAKSALDGILRDGMMIMSGGFGLCGIAEVLSDAIRDSGVKGLTVISNNAGVDGIGLSRLLETRQIKKMISSYVGENKLFAQQYLAGELEREFNPMMATAAKITVAEVEHLVPPGEIDPDHIHTPGIFIKRIVEVGTGKKRIEFRNTRPRPNAAAAAAGTGVEI